MASPLQSRIVALQMLQDILRDHKAMDQCLSTNRYFAKLSAEDRGFVRLLLATVLRHLGEIDAVWQGFMDKKLPKKAYTAADILRLGIAQLLFLKTPAHAAIHTSVELAKHKKLDGLKNLINAVLRRAQSEGEVKLAELNAITLNTPDWLYDSWANIYGNDVATAIAAAHAVEPGLDISVKSDPEKWAERLGAAILPNGSLRLKVGGRVDAKDGFGAGEWWVQDVAATIPARLLGKVAGKTVIDLCAAPGGKTAQLASTGANVIAVDQSQARIKRLEQNLRRLNLSAGIVCADAASWQPPEKVSHILLDSPCSATGTIRRHPDIPYLKTKDDINRLSELQLKILLNATQMLAPGGILVYAVCSLQDEEGPQIMAKALKQNPQLRRLPITAADLPEFADLINPQGDVRTLPCDLGDMGGMDGFYVCRLQLGA
ncbi:MAG: MFS transporter [Alphaproteobacteria bacterium]|nr:MAG: MFS transporter [Alphaproteobacteria bacterium]